MTDRIIEIDGVQHHFPADASDAEISAALSKPPEAPSPPGDMAKAFGDNALGRGLDTFNDATTAAGNAATFSGASTLNSAIAAPFRAIGKKVMEGDWAAPGWSDYVDAYNTEKTRLDAKTDEASARSPTASAVGTGAGMFAAIPRAGAAAVTSSLPQAMWQSARDSGAYGMASGFLGGRGTENRLEGGLAGGATGAVVGGAVPGAISLGGMLARPITNAVRGIRQPELEAARQGLLAIRADRANPNPTMLSDPEFAAAEAANMPVTNLERGGEATADLARKQANLSPQARSILKNTIDPRFKGQATRTADYVQNLVGGTNAFDTQAALEARAVKENAARYIPAMRAGNRLIDSPELARLANSPDMQSAIRAADPAVTSRVIAEGGGKADIPTTQNLQFWDGVKRRIDAKIAQAQGKDPDAVQRLTLLKNSLTDELDRQVPKYAAARAGAAGHFGEEKALAAGQKFYSGTTDINKARAVHPTFSPAEKELFAQGFTDKMVKSIEKTGDRRDVVDKIFTNPDQKKRILLALGPRRANELEARLRVETAMDQARKETQGNSTTTRQLISMLGLGETENYSEGHHWYDPRGYLYAGLGGHFVGKPVLHGLAAASAKRTAPKIAEMLTSNDPNVFNQAVQLIAQNPRWMKALRAFGTASGSVASQHSPL